MLITCRFIPRTVLASLCVLISGCSREPQNQTQASLPNDASGIKRVFAVNYPLKYFAARIGGDVIRASLPESSGFDPSAWTPNPETVAHYQEADLVLLNGGGYAGWIETASLRPSRLVDTSVLFQDRFIEIEDAVTHSHGNEGAHTHAHMATHFWLDPRLAALQAQAVRDALKRLLPGRATDFERNYDDLKRDLTQLGQALSDVISRNSGLPLLASHPVYQYLQRRYQMNLRSLHWEPHEPPDPAMWGELEEMLASHPARWILWEAEPLPETAARLKSLGIEGVVFHPCGGIPEHGDYLEIMMANVRALGRAFTVE